MEIPYALISVRVPQSHNLILENLMIMVVVGKVIAVIIIIAIIMIIIVIVILIEF